MPADDRQRILVVGGGITGLSAAAALVAEPRADVTVAEADHRLGGKILTSPFAGLAAVDEGPDAFLARVPGAAGLARRVGLGDALTSPTEASAAVWHDGLHPIPDGLVLGVPGSILGFARSGLLSWRGKARAALEPVLPRTSTDDDAIGPFVRRRFGDEVHERLVDALVGSIYGADTDRFSLRSVPQLADLATRHRSLLLGARSARSRATAVAPETAGPLFAAPTAGMGRLVDALGDVITGAGAAVRTGWRVAHVERDGAGWRVDDERFDQVVLTTPGRATAPLLAAVAPDAARLLGGLEHADVILVTLTVPAQHWPERLRGLSGYLVPKPDQRHVTAASFGSQKWAHWRPDDGSEVLRVSLGRDGLPVSHLDDDAVLASVADELHRHLAIDVDTAGARISRWPAAFPQYRPHHARWVDDVRAALPAGLTVGGASYDGIGIPACVRQGEQIAACLSHQVSEARY